MSLKNADAVTLSDIAATLGPDNKVATIIEILNKKNPILQDMRFIEGNLPTGHKSNIRAGLPDVVWRKFNYGVPNSKSRSVSVTDTCGMLEAYAEVDKRLADLGGNASAFRLREDKAFIEAMSQEFASALFYANTETDPEKFMGLAPRYADTTAENGENIFLGDGAGSTNTSIWLVMHGDSMVQGIYPKGTMAGIKMEDLGEQTLFDANNNKYQGYRSHYLWNVGLVVSDWRYVARGANIDVTKLSKDPSAGSDLIDIMTDMLEAIPSLEGGTPVFYCNKTVRSFLKKQIRNTSNVFLTMNDLTGRTLSDLQFQGVSVKRTDAILSTEEAIS